MKRIIFLIIATLLVLGIVLPGCGGGGGGAWSPYVSLKTPGKLTIGVTGAMGYDQGLHALYGAQLAAVDVGSFAVGNQTLTVQIQSIETNEVLNPGGAGGTAAVSAAISSCDFMVGGFRTEGVIVYREPIMSANMTFINCGAATEILQNAVLTNYPRYKYFFKGTPMNEYQLGESQSKLLNMIVPLARTVSGCSTYLPKIALLAEDAEWTRTSRDWAQWKFAAKGYNVSATPWLVSPTAVNIGTTLGLIAATNPDIVYCIFSGPVGITYGNTVGDYMPSVLSVGINVEAQRQEFPGAAKYAGPTTGVNSSGMVFLDGWALGVNMTANTAKFIADFMAAHSGKWPIYTAATYDACRTLVEALQNKGIVEGSTVKFDQREIVAFMEGSVRTGTASTSGVYPMWDGVTLGNWSRGYGYPIYSNLPALNETQVLALYPWLTSAKFNSGPPGYTTFNWSYSPNDFTMPPYTPHDLIYGLRGADQSTWATGIASQWQGVTGNLSKVGVWPKNYIAALGLPAFNMTSWLGYLAGAPNPVVIFTAQYVEVWDRYGWWNWEYPGTGSINITGWAFWLKTKYGIP